MNSPRDGIATAIELKARCARLETALRNIRDRRPLAAYCYEIAARALSDTGESEPDRIAIGKRVGEINMREQAAKIPFEVLQEGWPDETYGRFTAVIEKRIRDLLPTEGKADD